MYESLKPRCNVQTIKCLCDYRPQSLPSKGELAWNALQHENLFQSLVGCMKYVVGRYVMENQSRFAGAKTHYATPPQWGSSEPPSPPPCHPKPTRTNRGTRQTRLQLFNFVIQRRFFSSSLHIHRRLHPLNSIPWKT